MQTPLEFPFSAGPIRDKAAGMALRIYHRLARHLDDLPGGFPPTPDGVELRILERLFTPAEARVACQLTLIPETTAVIACRCRMAPDAAAALLDAMWRKGLLLRHLDGDRRPRYLASQFVVGIWEFQVNRLDPGLAADMAAYIPVLFDKRTWRRAPQMRTLPVQRSVDARLPILPHEAVAAMIERKTHFVISPCICRQERHLAGKGCNAPMEACISFGDADSYFVAAGIGRPVDRQTVLALLATADRAGLVLQASNSRDPAWICCCCGCCCGILRTARSDPRPADLLASPFGIDYDPVRCTGCGACGGRCQMAAIAFDGDVPAIDAKRCIGCGLCVSTCPTGALQLMRKPRSRPARVPANMALALLKTAWARNKIAPVKAIAAIARSQRDRRRATQRAERGALNRGGRR